MSVAPLPSPRQSSKKYSKPYRSYPPAQTSGAKIKQLPLQKQKLPTQLRSLLILQKGISLITLLLVGTTLGVYAWTVYLPKLWDTEYNKLKTLQNYERHLLTTNETLKDQLAQQAEKPEAGLANPYPSQTIFLPVSPNTSTDSPEPSITKPNSSPLVSTPLAY